MEDTCICPKCSMENAYFNGVCYECPDCDYKWDADGIPDEEEE